MKRRTIARLQLLLFFFPVFSAGQMTASHSYMGISAYTAGSGDVFSFTRNQAALARQKTASGGISAERKFLLKELNSYTAVLGIPLPAAGLGIKASYDGFAKYNESQVGLAYARSLGNKVSVGLQFNYNGRRAAGYESVSAIGFEAGMILDITGKFHTGIHVANLAGGFAKMQERKLPAACSVGFGYEPSPVFFTSLEIIKEEGQPVTVDAALEYRVITRLCIRAGISSNNSSGWFGVGLLRNAFRIDIISSYHPLLGLSPGLMLSFTPQPKAE